MNVLILEVCRSPEVRKHTEAIILSSFFQQGKIRYELYSNDGIWPERRNIDKQFLELCLSRPEIEVVHLAMHGSDEGLVLEWSNNANIAERVAKSVLTGPEIAKMEQWKNKLVVSGACATAKLSPYFLEAGATAVVAPDVPVSWSKLGAFFCEFYSALSSGINASLCLEAAIGKFPEYQSYRLLSEY